LDPLGHRCPGALGKAAPDAGLDEGNPRPAILDIGILILIRFQDETNYGTVSLWQDHEELTIN
jgi:hypothetical protein